MMRSIRRPRVAISTLAVVAIAAVALWLYTRQAAAAPQYRMASATIGTVTQTIPLSGNLTPVSAADLDFGTAGKVSAVKVAVGQSVNAGDVLATLDTSNLSGTLAQAQANLASAQAKLSLDEQGPTAQNLAQSEGALSSATVSLQNAQTSLNDTVASNAQAASQAQATVDSDQATVNADQNLLNTDTSARQSDQAQENTDCNANPSSQQCTDDKNRVTADNQKVASDQQTLTRDQGSLNAAKQAQAATLIKNQQGYDQAQAQVSSATVALQNAQAALKALQQGATSQQVAMDQAAVQVAQVNVDNAQRSLGEATLTAPVSGVITALNLVVGQSVSGGASSASSAAASTAATHQVSMLTPGAYQVTGAVSDAQVGQIATGQLARVTPAGMTEALSGKVTAVSPSATITSGVATFAVTVTLDATDLTIHPGVSAAVSIIVNQVVGVVTVPTSAIRSTGGTTAVQVLENGQPVMRPVQVGATDASRTQVLSGLNAGDSIVIATITRNVPTTTNGGGGFFGGGGGRVNGGGGRGGGGGGG